MKTTYILIDYILIDLKVNEKERLICQLTEAVFPLKKNVLIHCGSSASGKRLDQLLWTYKQESFLPHGLWPGSDFTDHPVLISHQGDLWPNPDVLILETRLPLNQVKKYGLIIDFTDSYDQELRLISGARYKECMADPDINLLFYANINDFLALGLNAALSG